MKVVIVGAGLSGLTAGLRLAQKGNQVTILEAGDQAGGLAAGFKNEGWQWSLENFYHHLFTTDTEAQQLIKELGLEKKLFFKKPKSSIYFNKQITRFDSPLSLLRFPFLIIEAKIRTALVTVYLKLTNDWQGLEKIKASEWLPKYYGKQAYAVLWQPLLKSKFGEEAEKISMAWFWARIKKRSMALGYLAGGFTVLTEKLLLEVKKLEGRVVYNTPVSDFKELQLKYPGAVFLFTTPFSITQKITGLKLADLKMIGAVNLILELSEQFFADKTYWLNINEKDYPFVAVVEHTNFVDKKHYGGKHILYVGGYYPQNHRYFTMSKEEILKEWRPYLHNINFKFQILNFKLARALYAQPIVGLNHHKFIPEITTKLPGVYVANMEMVYPWDRGTNYAIELGERAAKIIAS